MAESIFRNIYVVEPGFNFSALKPLCERIIYLTSGYEAAEELPAVISESLKDFSPEDDAIIPVGKVFGSVLTGFFVGSKFSSPVYLGIYNHNTDPPYTFITVGGEDET